MDERMEAPALEIEALNMDFGGFKALSEVSCSIAERSSTALVGPNGAGKTTLLNCICGSYRPSSGDIRLRGKSLLGYRPHHIATLGISRTFQNVEHLRSLTVLDLVKLGCHQVVNSTFVEVGLALPRARREDKGQRQVAMEMLELLNIGAFAAERLDTLPYAVRKSADLARALVSRPSLLLLDEPSAGMAEVEKEVLQQTLQHVRGSLYETLLIVDHDIQFLRASCEFSVVLDFGRKIAEGSTERVLGDPQVVEAYLGVPLSQAGG